MLGLDLDLDFDQLKATLKQLGKIEWFKEVGGTSDKFSRVQCVIVIADKM